MNGLTDKEVIQNRKLYGTNKIDVKNENKFIKILISSLGDPIIKIMLIAVSIRFIFMFSSSDWFETLGMLISIFLSSLISSLSEYGSNKSFRILQREYEKINVCVKRNGKKTSINSDDVVVGDIVIITSGEKVCADGIIIEGSVNVDESSINGESTEALKKEKDVILKGSIVTNNTCIFKVTRVGINTIYGSIAKEINEKSPDSPMKIRLTKLAKLISKIGIIGSIFVSLSYLFNIIVIQNNFDYNLIINTLKDIPNMINILIHALTLSLTIIIVCVPEGLPMMIALVLSSNMKRMLNNNVLVRKPVGIETSGSMQVLLMDKTGTITTGKLSVVGISLFDDTHYNNAFEIDDVIKEDIINSINYNNESYYDNNIIMGGNQTDKALLSFIGNKQKNKQIKNKINFNSNIKYSSVTLDDNNTYYKGAHEVLLNKCIYYYDHHGRKLIIRDKVKIESSINKYMSNGYRVLILVKNNILLGMVLLNDEIRKEAYDSIKNIENSGIHIIIASGDSVNTVVNIANKLDMLNRDSIILTHDELTKLSDQDILENYKKIRVIARALPSDKSRIASLLDNFGIVVGMTGDGVNDATALKKSSIGFSLGSGTEIAKEASDIVILDDNISSIEKSVLYGRTIFKSIRKFIIFQLTMNLSALFLSLVGPFIGITSPVTIMQMLWINMIMDTFAGIAFSYCPIKKEYLKESPIKQDENIMNKYMYTTIILISLYTCIMLILFLKLPITKLFIRSDSKYLLTAFFSLFIFINIFNAFNARTTRINILSNLKDNMKFVLIFTLIFIAQIFIIYNGGVLFRTYGLLTKELLFVLLLSSTVIPIDIIKKILMRKNKC